MADGINITLFSASSNIDKHTHTHTHTHTCTHERKHKYAYTKIRICIHTRRSDSLTQRRYTPGRPFNTANHSTHVYKARKHTYAPTEREREREREREVLGCGVEKLEDYDVILYSIFNITEDYDVILFSIFKITRLIRTKHKNTHAHTQRDTSCHAASKCLRRTESSSTQPAL